jgi:hypothetical protein
MRRRTLFRWLAAAASALSLPLSRSRSWAEGLRFPGQEADVLQALAITVLPSELGSDGIRAVVERFETWVRNYKEGADLEHGYGVTHVRSMPPSPVPYYLVQLQALRKQLLAGDAELNRKVIEDSLAMAGVSSLSQPPDGKHIISDLMSFYFLGSDAADLCYRAAIERYKCRGLDDSDKPPAPLRGHL